MPEIQLVKRHRLGDQTNLFIFRCFSQSAVLESSSQFDFWPEIKLVNRLRDRPRDQPVIFRCLGSYGGSRDLGRMDHAASSISFD